MKTKLLAGLAAGVAVVLGVALGASQASFAHPAHRDKDAHHMDHVFVIMMENHSREQILDPNNAGTPHLRALASTYGSAMNYYGVTQPSQPNYIAVTSGSTWGSAANNNNQGPFLDHTNIVDQFEDNHVSWKAYMESAPYPGYLGGRYMDPNGSGAYAPGHNPFVLYPSIVNNPSRLNKVVPLTYLDADIAANKVPEFVWITPNLCHDMHMGPGCDTLDETQLEQLGDNFVDQQVKKIMSSPAWTGNSTIFITYDEGPGGEYCCDSLPVTAGDLSKNPEVHGGGNVPMIVVSRQGARGYTNTVKYNHYSLLRTIEENWKLGYLGFASDSRQVKSLTPYLSKNS
ncbi:alkaline phosphatase family protein [Plantactinospora siamensis]|uniref:Alkaline phosphatase family protein n=1 Tax=Plantactinospora siamensis TaxID=555372 RepID=A0ABV6P3B4_9ACTN